MFRLSRKIAHHHSSVCASAFSISWSHMAQQASFPTVIDVEKAAEFVPAIKEETYVSMMPRICALEIALEAAQWKEGTHFIWSTGRAEGFERWNQKVLRVADTGPLAALKPEQLREAMSAQWK